MNLEGTRWARKSDGSTVRVVSDSDASGLSNRSIRLLNETTGRAFWATPEGLHRKYRSSDRTEGDGRADQ